MFLEKREKSATGKTTHEISIESQRLLGEGTYGKAFVVEARIYDSTNQVSKTREFVMKEYHPDKIEFARASIENHKKLRAAGLPVFTTFRLDEEHSRIIMTNGHSKEWLCVGTNRGSAGVENFSEFGRNRLDEIINFDDILNRIFTDAQKATDAGIQLAEDMIFWLIEKKESPRLQYVFGDLDAVQYSDNKNSLASKNISTVYRALKTFLYRNVGAKSAYVEQLNQKAREKGVAFPPKSK